MPVSLFDFNPKYREHHGVIRFSHIAQIDWAVAGIGNSVRYGSGRAVEIRAYFFIAGAKTTYGIHHFSG
jgi:hypothetical protein